ncbi:ribosomal protein S18-alanine N-acetyltransferase [Vagococcus vulneris]|nr:ribosomal protein S18-alanine N-acetyltransferase [Vagococcus vulneris]
MYQLIEPTSVTNELTVTLYKLSQAAFDFGSPWTEQQFADALANSNNRTLIICDDQSQNTLAYCTIQVVLDEAELLAIAVSPEQQGKNTGKRIWYEMKKLLRTEGCHKCFLEVRESNQIARSFYETLGFERIGTRKKYYHFPTESAILMAISL